MIANHLKSLAHLFLRPTKLFNLFIVGSIGPDGLRDKMELKVLSDALTLEL